MRRALWIRLVLSLSAVLLAIGTIYVFKPQAKVVGAVECPKGGVWSRYFSELPLAVPGGQPAITQGTTDIPEFNDCQQFIREENGSARFIALFAIFARPLLDNDRVAMVKSRPDLPGVAAGLIYAADSGYSQLGIEKDFNCIYFFGKSGGEPAYEARVVPVHQHQERCALPGNANDGTLLEVREIPIARDLRRANSAQASIPVIARWDWDPTNKTQYIGIRCGNAWCEVGRGVGTVAFGASPSYGTTGSTAFRSVVAVKGWYDEQRLAIPAPNATTLPVSDIVGTIIPYPHLGDSNAQPDASPYMTALWLPAAVVAISGPPGIYKSKLNLEQSGVGESGNQVSLCYAPSSAPDRCFPNPADKPTCRSGVTGAWSARVISVSGRTKYFCVMRTAHDNVQIPGIVRWRWALNDETMWIRCLSGCCEVQADE